MVSLTLYRPYLLEGLNFLDLTPASDISYDLPWFATRRWSFGLLNLPLNFISGGLLLFETLVSVIMDCSLPPVG